MVLYPICKHNETEFEALISARKNWVCLKCKKARKNIQTTDKCSSPPRSATQRPTVDASSQLLLSAIKDLTEEVKGLKVSLDANANEVKELKITLEKQASITFENAAKLDTIESLLEAQNSMIDGLFLENTTLNREGGTCQSEEQTDLEEAPACRFSGKVAVISEPVLEPVLVAWDKN
ncbi:unnamed protein product [Nezara viridula]|uniref:Uncharacterized protein n=1 Tax=Nezara viridula TaxID=85310 RepID=A0A9P0MTS2_NEZVI|nr:unnamed protein product [Nezara viridula]